MGIKTKSIKSSWFIIFILICFIGFSLYIIEVRPWLLSFQFYGSDNEISISPADTFTYWTQTSNPLILVPYNLMGPVILMTLFNINFDLLFLFFIFLFLYAIINLEKIIKINPFRFATLLLINPLVLFQFFAPNKEIIIIIALLFMTLYLNSGKYKYLFITIILSALSKPEFFALMLFFLIVRKLNIKIRPIIIISMILFLTVFYSALPNMESQSEVLLRGQTSASMGVTVMLQNLATNNYLYPLIIIPRILITVFESSTIYLFISGICMIFSFYKLSTMRKSNLKLNDDIVFFICLFIIMVSIVPFPHHRYILPVYPLMLIILLRPIKLKDDIGKGDLVKKLYY